MSETKKERDKGQSPYDQREFIDSIEFYLQNYLKFEVKEQSNLGLEC